MKLIIYVLCYDDASEEAAHASFKDHAWATVVRLPDDPVLGKYMEGASFLSTLKERRHEWEGVDFVGTLSWKAPEKMYIPADLADHLHKVAAFADVVAFMPSTEALVHQGMVCHPRFLEVWIPVLQEMGYTVSDAVNSNLCAFFCNYWVATPEWMSRFIDFYTRVTQAMETLPSVQDAVWSDAGYATHLSKERCMHIYGRPYIPYHPFIGERLPSFFFGTECASIVVMPLTKRTFWVEFYQHMSKMVDLRAKAAFALCQDV